MAAPINLIAAVGRRGQIGLKGELPWSRPDDLAWFKRTTNGGVIIVGAKTFKSLPSMPGRVVVVDDGQGTASGFIASEQKIRPGWPIWIAGGAKTYQRFAGLVNGLMLINFIDYDGEADAFFPFEAYGISRGKEK